MASLSKLQIEIEHQTEIDFKKNLSRHKTSIMLCNLVEAIWKANQSQILYFKFKD